ncbi:MAG: family 16 glycosylhydrolase [Marmoricola sp.]
MFRVTLLLATISVALLVTGVPDAVLHGDISHGRLMSSTQTATSGSILQRPVVRVLTAPSELVLNEPGTVTVQAEAPAVPGDVVVLDTAGTSNIGYNKVSQAVLDENLRATLQVTGREFVGAYRYWAKIPASATYQEGTSATFSVTIDSAPPPAGPTCGGDAPARADGTTWTCTFDDEFDGPTLDRRYWAVQTTRKSGFTTGTSAMYACAADTPDTVAVDQGNLNLSLVELPAVSRCRANKSSKYAFGQVMHFQTFSQTYGKYEVRAKIPDLDVPGSQQSFWLWPKKNTYGAWPASGEIDFAELYSSRPNLDRPYLHYLPGKTTAGSNDNITHANCPIRPGEYNTYGLEWKPGQLTVLLNGDVCFTDDYSSAAAAFQGKYSPFDKPFYLSLTQAMGTTGNVYDPAVVPEKVTTQIDYVRIWK